MADFTNEKSFIGSIYPVGANDGQEWSRVEPLITPVQLKNRCLFGIPLFSYLPDPVTGIRAELTDDLIKDYIDRSVAETELETGLSIFPVYFKEKKAFNRRILAEFWLFKGRP